MTLSFLEWASFWANVATVTFGVLAAIAAGFALYFSGRLGAAKDAELATFKKTAEASIAMADARAAEANQKAAEATEGSSKAVADAAHAQERTGRLEIEAAAQQERAARAEKDLLGLQQRIMPRSLSASQARALSDALENATTKGPVIVVCILGDAEGLAFASQLQTILRTTGWPGYPNRDEVVNQRVYSGTNPVGFGVVVASKASPPPHAVSLVKAFAAAGLPLRVAEDASIATEAVGVMVGVNRSSCEWPTRSGTSEHVPEHVG
jgi:hypothetical protein